MALELQKAPLLGKPSRRAALLLGLWRLLPLVGVGLGGALCGAGLTVGVYVALQPRASSSGGGGNTTNATCLNRGDVLVFVRDPAGFQSAQDACGEQLPRPGSVCGRLHGAAHRRQRAVRRVLWR